MSNFNFGSSAKAKRTLNIERFRGADFADNPLDISPERSPDCCNLIPDKAGAPVCRAGFLPYAAFDGRINGVHTLTTAAGVKRLVHHGTKLSLWQADGSQRLLRSDLADVRSRSAQLNGKLCILDGKQALICSEGESGVEVKTLAEAAYIPTTSIGRKAGTALGGTALEAANLLSPQRKNTFCVTGTGQKYLYLDSAPIKSVSSVRQLLSNGVWLEVSGWSANAAEGRVTFSDGLAATPVSGTDNYEVTFEALTLGDSDKVLKRKATEADKTTNDVPYMTFPSRQLYATRYWFKLGESLPKRSAELIFTVDNTYYIFNGDWDWSDPANYTESGTVWATTAKEGKQTIDLGYRKDDYTDEDEASWGMMRVDISIEQSGGFWYLTISNVHNGGEGWGGSDARGYEDNIVNVQINWREGETDVSAGKINGCTICQLYGVGGNADRLFVSGNAEFANMDWYSGYNDPTYWPDLGYTKIGSEASAVVGYSWLSDGTLAVHKQALGNEPTIWYRNGRLNAAGEAEFTLTQGAVGVGAVSKDAFVHFGDDNLCLSEQGVFAVSRAANEAVNERFAQGRSWFIDPRLCAEKDLGEAQFVSFRGRCYLAAGEHVYIAEANAPRTYVDKSGAYQYDWWFWDNVPVRVWYTGDNELMFGAADGVIYRFGDGYCDKRQQAIGTVEERPVSCWWHTPVLDLGSRTYNKKIKNAYVIAEAEGGSHVYLDYILQGLNNQTLDRYIDIFDFNKVDFANFGFETDEFPRNLPTNVKAKKVMFIQFKIYNEPGVGMELYGLTVMYTISGKYKG